MQRKNNYIILFAFCFCLAFNLHEVKARSNPEILVQDLAKNSAFVDLCYFTTNNWMLIYTIGTSFEEQEKKKTALKVEGDYFLKSTQESSFITEYNQGINKVYFSFPQLYDFSKEERFVLIQRAAELVFAIRGNAVNEKLANCMNKATSDEVNCLNSKRGGHSHPSLFAGITFATCVSAGAALIFFSGIVAEAITEGAATPIIVSAYAKEMAGLIGGCGGITAAVVGAGYETSNAHKDQCRQKSLSDLRMCGLLYPNKP